MNEIFEMSSRTVTLKRNEYLKIEGTSDTNIYYIESGCLKIFVWDEVEKRIIRFGYKGNIIAALDSFLTENSSPLCIQAIKTTVLKVATKTQLNKFIENDNNLTFWRNILENLVLQQMEREMDILTASPRQRYERVLKRSPQLFQEVPNKYIANYLRMSPETLSRLLKS
ncbi:Crp/Fnr family transcriptional regulator [Flavobacterium sp. UMI-01]|uniref:Crp/Fnr family transcriptional regulator n=1 Tax=Flavobacterium sp. UMI-01 TaxID=1441053 RepID=UPI001C7D4288|nr:Crp/Fnr family transcriptional regulator [Flavobacterium sp. UMI-01]GIZ09047.1 Crp/Fnr family transcriptional regulator [Flavobacterium sp. UMI-01]